MTRRLHPRDLTQEKIRRVLPPETVKAFALLERLIGKEQKTEQKRQRKATMARAALRLVKKRGA
jgi:hypothetical protein